MEYRSNIAEKIGIIWTILSIIGSFIAGYIFRIDVGYSMEILKYNWVLTICLLVYTVIQAYILYCIYAHLEHQEQLIDQQIKTNEYLHNITEALNKLSDEMNNDEINSDK